MFRFRSCVFLLLIAALPLTAVAENVSNERYVIDSDQSWIRVLVYRGGLLGNLGHNHVVSHEALTGMGVVDAADPEVATLRLSIPVADFDIDDPCLRAAEGEDFPGEMSAKDIAGTRKNMLGKKLLNAERFPTIELAASFEVAADRPDNFGDADLKVSILGESHTLKVPTLVVRTTTATESFFVASGEAEISHRALGLKPFKAALGALRVDDKLTLKFYLRGTAQPE